MALKLIFMGTPEFAVPILEKIYKSNHNILSVYTQSPKKKKEDKKLIQLRSNNILKNKI